MRLIFLFMLFSSFSCKPNTSSTKAITGSDSDGRSKAIGIIAVKQEANYDVNGAVDFRLVECETTPNLSAGFWMKRLESLAGAGLVTRSRLKQIERPQEFSWTVDIPNERGFAESTPCRILESVPPVDLKLLAYATQQTQGFSKNQKPTEADLKAYEINQMFFLALRGHYANGQNHAAIQLRYLAKSLNDSVENITAYMMGKDGIYNPCFASTAAEAPPWLRSNIQIKNQDFFYCDPDKHYAVALTNGRTYASVKEKLTATLQIWYQASRQTQVRTSYRGVVARRAQPVQTGFNLSSGSDQTPVTNQQPAQAATDQAGELAEIPGAAKPLPLATNDETPLKLEDVGIKKQLGQSYSDNGEGRNPDLVVSKTEDGIIVHDMNSDPNKPKVDELAQKSPGFFKGENGSYAFEKDGKYQKWDQKKVGDTTLNHMAGTSVHGYDFGTLPNQGNRFQVMLPDGTPLKEGGYETTSVPVDGKDSKQNKLLLTPEGARQLREDLSKHRDSLSAEEQAKVFEFANKVRGASYYQNQEKAGLGLGFVMGEELKNWQAQKVKSPSSQTDRVNHVEGLVEEKLKAASHEAIPSNLDEASKQHVKSEVDPELERVAAIQEAEVRFETLRKEIVNNPNLTPEQKQAALENNLRTLLFKKGENGPDVNKEALDEADPRSEAGWGTHLSNMAKLETEALKGSDYLKSMDEKELRARRVQILGRMWWRSAGNPAEQQHIRDAIAPKMLNKGDLDSFRYYIADQSRRDLMDKQLQK